MDRIVLRH